MKARKEVHKHEKPVPIRHISKKDYRNQLYDLQVELVKCQRHVMSSNTGVLVILEGRDAAGKDGLIKRVIEHLSPRDTRVVALGKPSDREQNSWYFQRYVQHLPTDHELVLFNRSWYNRAGVEKVMKFSTKKDRKEFYETVGPFEQMLVHSGIVILKYYLDVSREEQTRRMESRKKDPLKQWKISPIDAVALDHYDDYTKARDEMLAATNFDFSPWTIVRADNKRVLRLNAIRDMLSRIDYPDKDKSLTQPDRSIVFPYNPDHPSNGLCY